MLGTKEDSALGRREVRRARLDDFVPIAQLYLHLNSQTPVLDNPKARETWLEIIADRNVAVFVGIVDAQLVASCTLITAPNLMLKGTPNAFLENVVTHGEYRRQGHGSSVIAAALQEAWRRGCSQVALFTGRGRANPYVLDFYESCGLHQEGKAALVARRPTELSRPSRCD